MLTDKQSEWEERLMLIRGALLFDGDLTKKEVALYLIYGKDAEAVAIAAKRYFAGEYTCQN